MHHSDLLQTCVIFLIYGFLCSIVDCAIGLTDASRSLAPLQLSPMQTDKLTQLFVQKNVSLQFEVSQRAQTDCVLFQLEVARRAAFRIAASTAHNQIRLELSAQSKNGVRQWRIYKVNAPPPPIDGHFHRIIVTLNGARLRIVDNCRQLLDTIDEDLDFRPLLASQTKIFIASDQFTSEDSDVGFHGQIREFTAGAGDPVASRCAAGLETFIDNPVLREIVDIEDNEEVGQIDSDPSIDANRIMTGNEQNRALLSRREASDGNGLAERIDDLERQINHWNSIYDKIDGRVKRVELHLRGCQVAGRMLTFGQRHQDLEKCTECQCSSSGELHCGPIGCPQLDCPHPIRMPGRCCPQCGRQCLYNGRNYESGETFWPKQCVRCTCDDGSMRCQFKQATQCPVLDCAEQFTPPNQCCPVCANVNHCLTQPHACDPNADCRSGEYAPICICKQGFFGNGTVCYDIDECLWNESARQHMLNGCHPGTICINLPGSYKCECLPGFQKLDERSCLDVIRI